MLLLQVVDMPGHNSSLFVLGVMILWFGWYGFNPGSQLALVGYSGAIANAAITTTLAPAFASMSALTVKSIMTRKATGAAALLIVKARALLLKVSVQASGQYFAW